MHLSFEIPAPASPFSLEKTVLSHGWWEIPPFAWDAGLKRLSIAFRPVGAEVWTIGVRQTGAALELRLTGAGKEPVELRATAVGLVRWALQLDADLGEFYRICEGYEPLRWVPKAGAGRTMRGLRVEDDVVASICGTNIQWKQAVACVRRIATLAPEGEAGAQCFPTPGEILAAGEGFLRETGRVGYRAASILKFCRAVESGALEPKSALRAGSGEEARRFFRSLPGIGPVTARYLATLYGHPDEISVDSLVLRYLGDKYHGGQKPTEAEVRQRYARFGRHQALAYWFEFLGDVDPITWRGWQKNP